MSSPAFHTLTELRRRGYEVAIAERWIAQAGIRKDLFGCIDLVAIKAGEPILGVQATSISNVAARLTKAKALPALRIWLAAGGRFAVWGWEHRGKWVLREVEVRGEDLGEIILQAPRPRRARKGQRQGLLFEAG